MPYLEKFYWKLASTKLLLVLCLALFATCKDAPSLSADNPIDPESSFYKISAPTALEIETNAEGIHLTWDHSNAPVFDGYLVQRSISDSSNFEIIAEIGRTLDNYTDTPFVNAITYIYQITAYYDQSNKRILSEPILVELKQEIFEVSATQLEDLEVEINIDHNFIPFSEFRIEQRVGENSPFELIKLAPTDSFQYIIKYNSLPQEEVTYRVFVENGFEKTDYFETLVYGYFEAPKDLTVTRNEETEVEISWTDNTEGVDEYLLYSHSEYSNTGGVNYQIELLLRVSGNKTSVVIDDLNPNKNHQFILQTRKGGFYSSFNTGFELINDFPNIFDISTPFQLNGFETISGGVSSDGKYFAFDTNKERQYVYDANTLEQTYKYEPLNRFVSSTVVEIGSEVFFSEHRTQNGSGVVQLKKVSNNQVSKTIPPFSTGGFIQEISFIDNRTLAIVYSSKVTSDEETHVVALYDYSENQYVNTLIFETNRNYFKSSSSNKSILVYDVYNNSLKRFSISDYSLINEFSLSDKIDSEILYFEAESVADSLHENTDYYNFKVQFSEIFRMDMENPVKEILDFDPGSRNTLYQFGSSKNGSLKCVNTINNVQCFSYGFVHAFTIDISVGIAGFLLSHNDDFIIIFTESEIQKYTIQKEWSLINYENEPF